jgi:hypothetical protein
MTGKFTKRHVLSSDGQQLTDHIRLYIVFIHTYLDCNSSAVWCKLMLVPVCGVGTMGSGSNFTHCTIARTWWKPDGRQVNRFLDFKNSNREMRGSMLHEEKICWSVYSINIGENDLQLVFLLSRCGGGWWTSSRTAVSSLCVDALVTETSRGPFHQRCRAIYMSIIRSDSILQKVIQYVRKANSSINLIPGQSSIPYHNRISSMYARKRYSDDQ